VYLQKPHQRGSKRSGRGGWLGCEGIMDFGVWAMLFGLFAVAIPPLVHLLNRRRYDVVDWGAMQFLKVSARTRRRLFLEGLLMLLRMLLIAVLVLALAAPALTGGALEGWWRLTGAGGPGKGSRANYDLVLVFDGSASMSFAPAANGESLHEAAKKWALDLVND